MDVTPLGTLIEVNPDCLNARSPMLVTLLGMVKFCNLTHNWNVLSGIVVIPDGNVTEDK